MIPCVTAPIEPQIDYEHHSGIQKKGTLRCLEFSNQDDSNAAMTTSQSTRVDSLKRAWLTFGLLYDIFATAWFSDGPMITHGVQFDYTFKDPWPLRAPYSSAP